MKKFTDYNWDIIASSLVGFELLFVTESYICLMSRDHPLVQIDLYPKSGVVNISQMLPERRHIGSIDFIDKATNLFIPREELIFLLKERLNDYGIRFEKPSEDSDM